jgi:hypothetical protein
MVKKIINSNGTLFLSLKNKSNFKKIRKLHIINTFLTLNHQELLSVMTTKETWFIVLEENEKKE